MGAPKTRDRTASSASPSAATSPAGESRRLALLAHPGRFKGGGAVGETAKPHDLAVANGEQLVALGAHRHAAPGAPALLARDHQHVIAAIDDLLRLVAVLIELLKPVLHRLPRPLVTAVGTPIDSVRALDPLDLGSGELRDQLGQGGQQVIEVHRFADPVEATD